MADDEVHAGNAGRKSRNKHDMQGVKMACRDDGGLWVEIAKCQLDNGRDAENARDNQHGCPVGTLFRIQQSTDEIEEQYRAEEQNAQTPMRCFYG